MVNVIFFIAILQKKSWGLLAFFGMLILQIPLNLIFGNAHVEDVAFSAFVRMAIMSLLFLIPKNGITGWRVLFPKRGPAVVEDNSGTKVIEPLKEILPAKEEEPEIVEEGPIMENETQDIQVKVKTKAHSGKWLIKEFPMPIWAVCLACLVIIIGLFVLFMNGGRKSGQNAPEFFYLEDYGNGYYCYHLNPRCEDGLVYTEASKIYDDDFDAEEFCAKCISSKQMAAVRDSCKVHAARKEANKQAKSIRYRVGDKTYNIPIERKAAFLERYPDAIPIQ